ncbi:hypothetical protein H072_4343 [Dactylellina haptotyla CBS 200.50]|uniref:PA14 domain-containing protein n=1 Tax=Dactylellina haptotyla (strain CBS 200.50) TaxID=1284197 RepID=S8C299_DACHA|nr:hypothetical protein H072_4343 [Dactylellina haptotyla CBS 200.50]
MLFAASLLLILAGAGRIVAQCTCKCIQDNCVARLAGPSPFPSQATVDDCRSFLWTSITVGADTVTRTGTPPSTAPKPTDPPSPGRVVPNYAAACANSASYSSACECIGVTATGTTYIHVPTETVWVEPTIAPTPDISCGNAGLEVAIYNNPYTEFSDGYPSFIPESFKTNPQPYGNSTADSMGLHTGAEVANPHGLTPATADVYTLNYRGYFYAPKTADYTLLVTDADDIALFWAGTTARTGWVRDNSDGITTFSSSPIPGQKTFSLTAGQYFPIRVMYANRGGPGKYTFQIFDATDPSLSYVAYGASSPYLISRSCDDPSTIYSESFGSES